MLAMLFFVLLGRGLACEEGFVLFFFFFFSFFFFFFLCSGVGLVVFVVWILLSFSGWGFY